MCVCKNTVAKDPTISLHQFPSSRLKWPEMTRKELKTHFRVCSICTSQMVISAGNPCKQ